MKIEKYYINNLRIPWLYKASNNENYIEIVKTNLKERMLTPWTVNVYTKNRYFIYQKDFKRFREAKTFIETNFI